MNLASRLTDAAKPGEILISEMVAEALSGRLQVEAPGAVPVNARAEASKQIAKTAVATLMTRAFPKASPSGPRKG